MVTVSGVWVTVPPAPVRTITVNVLGAAERVDVIVNFVEPEPETAVGENAKLKYGGIPEAENATVPVKLVAVSITVTEPAEPLLIASEVALRLVATEPIVTGSVAV